MKIAKIIISMTLILFSSCQNRSEGNESSLVILKFQPEWNWIYENVKPTELTTSELSQVEQILIKAVADYNLGQADFIKERKEWFEEQQRKYPDEKLTDFEFELKLEKYKRQYVPVINESGEKEVWINLFCSDYLMDETWKTDIQSWQDGGNCFWNVKINLTKKIYYSLEINGSV